MYELHCIGIFNIGAMHEGHAVLAVISETGAETDVHISVLSHCLPTVYYLHRVVAIFSRHVLHHGVHLLGEDGVDGEYIGGIFIRKLA